MPSRRRSKVGNRRRDAAYDAMRAFGFSEDLVRKTLNDLLKVYGDDGWAFIEENCYKVLTEAILDIDDQHQPDQDQDNHIDNQLDQDQDNFKGNQPEEENLIGNQNDEDQENITDNLLDRGNPIVDNGIDEQYQLVESVQQGQEQVESVPELEDGGKEICVQEMTELEQPIDDASEVENCLARQEVPQSKLEVLAHDTTSISWAPLQTIPSKPCFGWISDDDDDNEEDDVDDDVISVHSKEMKCSLMHMQF